MESLRAAYKDEEDDEEEQSTPNSVDNTNDLNHQTLLTPMPIKEEEPEPEPSWGSEEDLSEEENDQDDDSPHPQPTKRPIPHPDQIVSPSEEEDEDEINPTKKHKPLSSLTPRIATCLNTSRKSAKKKPKQSNVWAKSARKGKKKGKGVGAHQVFAQRSLLSTPTNRLLDKSDDSVEMKICLSKIYKAEKVELSEDRLCAGSSKGYRMVRATRGVVKGAWYFEIKVEKLGETGHTRLGWSTEKGDLQAPVGYDGNSFGYRDIDGGKIHKALREDYGEGGYVEGDVIGFYINLPDGDLYAPKTRWVWHKGQKFVCPPNGKEEPNEVVPGSEVLFFKNGVSQGVAFKDICGGCYYPAASMYTLPNQPNCVVRFNFGPEFTFFPEDFGGRPIPTPMIEVPYQDFDGIAENGTVENGETLEKKPQLSS